MANEVPKFEGKVEVQPSGNVPRYGAAYASLTSENILGSLGAKVAQVSSQELATKLGTEAGKNPHGELFPAITDFDKHFAAAYTAQAGAELNLQANKLVSDSEIQLASANRLTPKLISDVNSQVGQGLARIASIAPPSIKTEMQANFANTMIAMNQRYQIKMIGEQREDTKQKNLASLNQQLKNTVEIGQSGNYQGAEDSATWIENMAKKAVASHQISPDQGNILIDAAHKAAKSSIYVNQAMKARAEGKYEEFAAKFGTKKPDDLTYEQWQYTASAIQSQVGLMDNLRAKNEALLTNKMNLSLIENPTGISGSQEQEYKENVSPNTYATYLVNKQKALNKYDKKSASTATATANFHNVDKFRDSKPEANLHSLDEQATAMANERGISEPQAQAIVAAGAPGPIKPFLDRIALKAQSPNPQEVNEAIAQRDLIASSINKQNLTGLDPQAEALMNRYSAMKGTMDDASALALAREATYSSKPEKQKALDEAWAEHYKNKKRSGETEDSFALRMADIDKDAFVSVPELKSYVNDKYQTFFHVNNGNVDLAQRQLQDSIKRTFGYDTTNGRKQFALFPIKEIYHLPENSNGFIHEDMKEQVDAQLKDMKDLYDKKQVDSYYEIKPKVSFDELNTALEKTNEVFNPKPGQYKDSNAIAKAHAEFLRDQRIYQGRIDEFKQGKPPTAIQHFRDGHIQEFDLEIRADPQMSRKQDGGINGSYEVQLQEKGGTKAFTLANPNQTVIRYKPNAGRIRENYLKVYPFIEHEMSLKDVDVKKVLKLSGAPSTKMNAPIGKKFFEELNKAP